MFPLFQLFFVIYTAVQIMLSLAKKYAYNHSALKVGVHIPDDFITRLPDIATSVAAPNPIITRYPISTGYPTKSC